MKGSLTVIALFVLGCLLGWLHLLPVFFTQSTASQYVLYLLMFLVGLSIGSDNKLKEILRNLRPKLLLVPAATIVGTLSFSALAALILSQWSVWECLSVGSGFAYYSFGLQAATELGTIALIANIIREITALVGAPLFVKYFGRLSPICAGGATTMDTTLPIITQYAGKDMVFIAIIHGIIVDFTVPLFVSLFCSL